MRNIKHKTSYWNSKLYLAKLAGLRCIIGRRSAAGTHCASLFYLIRFALYELKYSQRLIENRCVHRNSHPETTEQFPII